MINLPITGVGVTSVLGVGSKFLDFSQYANQTLAKNLESPGILTIEEFDPSHYLSDKGLKFLTLGTQMALVSAKEAMAGSNVEQEKLGVALGSNYAGLKVITAYDKTVITEGPSYVSPMDSPNTLANVAASRIGISYGAQAFNSTISTGNCASLDAIGYAGYFLEKNLADVVITGGMEEIMVPFNRRIVGSENELPYSEGAAILCVRKKTSVKPLAFLRGCSNCWGNPQVLAKSTVSVCLNALQEAGISLNDLSLMAIGLSSSKDQEIIDSIADAFLTANQVCNTLSTFNLRPLLGNTVGASGAMHTIAAIKALNNSILPATIEIPGIVWPKPFKTAPTPIQFDPGYALIVEIDSEGGASAIVIAPAR